MMNPKPELVIQITVFQYYTMITNGVYHQKIRNKEKRLDFNEYKNRLGNRTPTAGTFLSKIHYTKQQVKKNVPASLAGKRTDISASKIPLLLFFTFGHFIDVLLWVFIWWLDILAFTTNTRNIEAFKLVFLMCTYRIFFFSPLWEWMLFEFLVEKLPMKRGVLLVLSRAIPLFLVIIFIFSLLTGLDFFFTSNDSYFGIFYHGLFAVILSSTLLYPLLKNVRTQSNNR